MPTLQVFIVESPSAKDLLDRQYEGGTLRAALGHAGIEASLLTVVNEDMLFEAASRLLDQLKRPANPKAVVWPILHLSMHGNESGVGLTDGTEFLWKDLGDIVDILNARSGANLLVCISTCHGFSGALMADREQAPPFFALVGPERTVSWRDTVAAFVALYHHLSTPTGTVESATDAMNRVLNVDKPLFTCVTGDFAKKVFDDGRAKEVAEYASRVARRIEERPPGSATTEMRGLLGSVRVPPR